MSERQRPVGSTGTCGNKAVERVSVGVVLPFLPPGVSAPFIEPSAVPCWGRGAYPLWSVGASVRRAQGRTFYFQWKTSSGC